MSKKDIIAELPRLSRADRRELVAVILELDDEPQELRDCDRRANERFLELEALEAEDAKTRTA